MVVVVGGGSWVGICDGGVVTGGATVASCSAMARARLSGRSAAWFGSSSGTARVGACTPRPEGSLFPLSHYLATSKSSGEGDASTFTNRGGLKRGIMLDKRAPKC